MRSTNTQLAYSIKATEVVAAIFDLDYRLPKQEALKEKLSARGILPMSVAPAAQADFTASDLDAFLDYVTANEIKAVMFSYTYYTEKDVTDTYKLSDADRSFFRAVFPPYSGPAYNTFLRDQYNQNERLNPKNSDFRFYRLYTKYVEAALDLSCPRSLKLYAMHEGKVIALELTDDWLERLPLPNARTIKNACANTRSYGGYSDGILSFSFDYDYPPQFGTGDKASNAAIAESMHRIDTELGKTEELLVAKKTHAAHETQSVPKEPLTAPASPAADTAPAAKPAEQSPAAKPAEPQSTDYAKKKSRKKRNKGKRRPNGGAGS